MNRTWFDRCYGELLRADAVQRDPRLTALWEAEDCAAVKEGIEDDGLFRVEKISSSWYITQDHQTPKHGGSLVLKPYDSRDEAMRALKQYKSTLAGQHRIISIAECDDMTAKTEEAAGVLNTFSTKGSLGIPMKVEKVGSKYYVVYTSGSIVDWDLPPFGTYGEALAAAKRLAAEEGVRVEEGDGQGTAEQVFSVLRKGAATVEMVADEVGITAEQAQRVLDNLQARAMIRRRGDRYFMEQFS